MKHSYIKHHPRPAAETDRIYGDEERRAWMTRQPCAFCERGPCVSAHIKGGGTGRKADAFLTLPMCTPCHDEYDGRSKPWGRVTFLANRGLTFDDVLVMAAEHERRWQGDTAIDRAWA